MFVAYHPEAFPGEVLEVFKILVKTNPFRSRQLICLIVWGDDENVSSRFKHSAKLSQEGLEVLNMFDDVDEGNQVKIGVWQACSFQSDQTQIKSILFDPE